MAVIHAQEISLAATKGGVLVTYTSGDETVSIFIPRHAFMVALQESKDLVSELEGAEVVELRA